MQKFRDPNFTPFEDLALVKSWISTSLSVTEHNIETFWDNVARTAQKSQIIVQ